MSESEEIVKLNRLEHVAIVEMNRPPYNYIDVPLLSAVADACEAINEDPSCRAIVLASAGRSFCAGGGFVERGPDSEIEQARQAPTENPVYAQGLRLFSISKPIVAAVHGPAIGGGLGLALVADFRVTCREARFSANFTRLGFHPGFGLTVTLPELVGRNMAEFMFYTSRRFNGDEAFDMGLANVLVEQDAVRDAAIELATEIAQCSPLGLLETRATMRAGLVERIREATRHEFEVQNRLRLTADYREGVAAMGERRTPNFIGR